MNKKQVLAGTALLMGLSLTGCATETERELVVPVYEKTKEVQYLTDSVMRGDLDVSLRLELVPVKPQPISYMVSDSGMMVEKIWVKEGDHVKKGQLLVSYEAEELEKNMKKLQEEKEKLEMLYNHYENLENLHDADKQERYAVELLKLKEDLDYCLVQIEVADKKLKNRQIYAREGGTISFISKKLDGGYVEAGETVMTQIIGEEHYTVTAPKDRDFLAGEIFPASNGIYTLKLMVESVEETPESRIITFKNIEEGVLGGNKFFLELAEPTRQDVVYVQKRDVQTGPSGTYVYLLNGEGYPEGRLVKTGDSVGEYIVIEEGLTGEEEVLIL